MRFLGQKHRKKISYNSKANRIIGLYPVVP
jgi:hypothetical protein